MDTGSSLYGHRLINFLKKWEIVNLILGCIDILSIALAFQFAYLINNSFYGFFFNERDFLFLFLGILPFWLLILYFIKITEIPRTKSFKLLFYEYFQSAIAILFLLIIFYYVFDLEPILRIYLVEITFFGFIFLFTVRFVEYKFFKLFRAKGHNLINVVLIADDSSYKFIDNLITNNEWGYKVFAIFTESELIKQKFEKYLLLFPSKHIKVLVDLMEVDLIDEVLYLKRNPDPDEVRQTVSYCEELGVTFRLKYNESRINLTNAIKTSIADEKFLTFINIPHNLYALSIKKIMDINFSLFMIVALSPILLLISALIKFTSPGPVIYKQIRVGLRGRQFNIYKFRTMVSDAESIQKEMNDKNEMDGPVFKIKDDPRITKIGKFLRKSGLDELPQLFNVLNGEMSLIGPRPPLPSETIQYKRWQLRRLSVKPGLSCSWQIEPNRNSIKFEKWMEMDLAYIDNWSIHQDFIIFLKTIKTVFRRTGL